MGEKKKESETQKVFRTWDKIQRIKRQLVKSGELKPEASTKQVLEKIREQIRAEHLMA